MVLSDPFTKSPFNLLLPSSAVFERFACGACLGGRRRAAELWTIQFSSCQVRPIVELAVS